jgi:hypothetical protein
VNTTWLFLPLPAKISHSASPSRVVCYTPAQSSCSGFFADSLIDSLNMPPKPKRQKQRQSKLMTIPIEIRLNIYGFVFGVNTAILEAQCIASENRSCSYLLHKQRSSQILQTYDKVCKEARVILFANTTFIVSTHADFHRLPYETSCLCES